MKDIFEIIGYSKNNKHRIGRCTSGSLCYIINTVSVNQKFEASIISQSLEINFNQYCDIYQDNELAQSEIFSIIKLRSENQSLENYFKLVFEDIICSLPDYCTVAILKTKLQTIFNLFSPSTSFDYSSLIGILGELIVVYTHSDISNIISQWHVNPSSYFDFGFEDNFIEVKATSKNRRLHKFSYEQSCYLLNHNSYLASILVNENDKGMNIIEFIELIRNRISTVEIRQKFDKIVFSCISIDSPLLSEYKFDISYSCSSLVYLNMQSIPHLSLNNQPRDITNIKYEVSLENIDKILQLKEYPI